MNSKIRLKKIINATNYYLLNPLIICTVRFILSLFIFACFKFNIVYASSFEEQNPVNDQLLQMVERIVVAVDDEGLRQIELALEEARQMDRQIRLTTAVRNIAIFIACSCLIVFVANYGPSIWDFIRDTGQEAATAVVQVVPQLARSIVRDNAVRTINMVGPEAKQFLQQRLVEITQDHVEHF